MLLGGSVEGNGWKRKHGKEETCVLSNLFVKGHAGGMGGGGE
jgi:hypothetical protein